MNKVRLLVMTGDARLDKMVYELAFNGFTDLVPLAETGPFDAAMEVTFSSTGQNIFFGSSTTTVNTQASATGWYSGTGYVSGNYWHESGTLNATATGTATANTVTAGGALTYQNSTMIITLKDRDGRRLWYANYTYKGGWEFSGWVVNTPEDAARLLVKRLASKMQKKFK